MMRAMVLEFPDDPACDYLDRQYMLGDDVLVAPVFSPSGEVTFYLPAGTWTDFARPASGGRPAPRLGAPRRTASTASRCSVRPGAVIPIGARDDRPDYDYRDGVTLAAFAGADGTRTVSVATPDGEVAEYTVRREGSTLTASGPDGSGFTLLDVATGRTAASSGGRAEL